MAAVSGTLVAKILLFLWFVFRPPIDCSQLFLLFLDKPPYLYPIYHHKPCHEKGSEASHENGRFGEETEVARVRRYLRNGTEVRMTIVETPTERGTDIEVPLTTPDEAEVAALEIGNTGSVTPEGRDPPDATVIETMRGRTSERSRRVAKVDLDSLLDAEDEMMKTMGFGGFDTTKNKKVEGNIGGTAKINKPRKFRQYMNPSHYSAIMGEEFIGCVVYVDCGNFGNYQGRLSAINLKDMTITLTDAMKNGQKSNKKFVLNSAEVTDLKVLEVAPCVMRANTHTTISNSKSNAESKNGKEDTQRSEKVRNEAKKPQNKEKSRPEQVNGSKKSPEVGKNDGGVAGIMQKLMINPEEKLKEQDKPSYTILKRDPAPTTANVSNVAAVLPTSVIRANAQKKSEKPKDKDVAVAKPNASTKSKSKSPADEISKQKAPVREALSAKSVSPALNSTELGVRIDPHSLISCLSTSVSPGNTTPTTKESKSHSNSVHDQAIHKSASSSSAGNFQQFGEFKKFTDQQKPMPCKLERNNSTRRRGNNNPSGMPLVDFNNGYGHVHRKNRHLDEDVDAKVMDSDFDFAGNLALFTKEEVESEEESGSNEEAPADIRNYRNDENVLGDPTRVTSWTAKMEKNLPVSHNGFVYTRDGRFKVPVLSGEEKQKFIEIVGRHLGFDCFNTLVAERLISLFFKVVKQHSLDVGNVAIIGSKSVNPVLLDRLCVHLANRSIHTSCIGFSVRNPLPGVVTAEPKDVNAAEVVFILDEDVAEKVFLTWLVTLANGKSPAHVITLESERPGCSFVHSLYLQALAESRGKKAAGNGETVRYIADLGVPFNFFKPEAAEALTDTFTHTTMDPGRCMADSVEAILPMAEGDFGFWRVLALSAHDIRSFWHMWLAILLWMTVSYVVIHVVAFLCAVVMLRHHPWMVFLSFPFLAMVLVGPSTFGALTSASIAWTFALANKSITSWHCMFLGCGQTLVVVILSFSRILATL
ncbi:hypothetical protein FO519_001543 [Halicephalobus sp. NKZ332]|nr:hypothetical protein FO519_001543 [Halicephalobus sp. NKZ332]